MIKEHRAFIGILLFCLFLIDQSSSQITKRNPVTNETELNYKGNESINIHGKQITSAALKFMRVGFRSNGCTCQNLTCGCCFGMNITQFNYDREGCMNFSYDPLEFALLMDILWAEDPIFHTGISGKNPPPICLPVPIPYIPNVDFCVKLFNIHTPGRNIHVCVDVETRIQRAPILLLHFDCIKLGSDGYSLVKPGRRAEQTTEMQTENSTDILN
ncbi:uncharacterized protein CBL_11771 [Carabus blaptoides fortunei]